MVTGPGRASANCRTESRASCHAPAAGSRAGRGAPGPRRPGAPWPGLEGPQARADGSLSQEVRAATEGTPMLHQELMEIQEPVLRKVPDRPFWSGLRERFAARRGARALRPSGHGVPSPRLRPCAGPVRGRRAGRGRHVPARASRSPARWRRGTGCARPMPVWRAGWACLRLMNRLPVDPAIHAHASFFAAASAASFHAGLGALLPMVWFNSAVSDNFERGAAPRVALPALDRGYHPGESYRHAVRAFADMADRAGEDCSARQRQLIVEHFSISIRYEWAFAECCLRPLSWPA